MILELLTAMKVGNYIAEDTRPNDSQPSTGTTYFVEWGIVLTLLAIPYAFTWVFGISNAGLDKIVHTLSYPLHWEFQFMTTDAAFMKWFAIGGLVASAALFIIQTIAKYLEETILGLQSHSEKVNGLYQGFFLLNLLFIFWTRLLLPVAIVKTAVCGVLFILGMG